MGILIAFWSPLHGRGNTSNCIATAMQLSMKYNIESYITHTHYTRSTMECAFLDGKEEEDILKLSDLGLDSINRAIKAGLDVEDVKSYCNKINDKLYLISGSKKSNIEVFQENIGRDFGNICDFIKQGDNVCFVDIDSGYKSDIAKEIIDIADYVVVTLDQTNLLCEDYLSSDFRVNQEKEITVMGRFDNNSKYTKKYLSKKFKKEVFVIPTDSEFLDSLNNHRVKSFFDKKYDIEDDLFFDELNILVDELASNLEAKGMFLKLREEKPKKKFIFFNI
ncbi:hypothetical protein FDA33_10440 [Clostridium botulinum]|nr:hypothetical protein [Clostridium botulinum]KOR55627.1 hypothetical protein ADT22_15445 [Clostridium botulinum]MBN1050399.1 hypothetical protein [Clostridium botulinum]MBY6811022.1 hypothetical protein [Clostridium botulinum]MBY6818499.1 hypothetical protein [Clostridium botulinum]MBY6824490.1 hypothetical protein [Clostridium botulinum]